MHGQRAVSMVTYRIWGLLILLLTLAAVNIQAQRVPPGSQPLSTPPAQRVLPLQTPGQRLPMPELPQPLPTLDRQPRLTDQTPFPDSSASIAIALLLDLDTPQSLADEVLRGTTSPLLADFAYRGQAARVLLLKAALRSYFQRNAWAVLELESRPTHLPVMLLEVDASLLRDLQMLPGVRAIQADRIVPLPEPRMERTPAS